MLRRIYGPTNHVPDTKPAPLSSPLTSIGSEHPLKKARLGLELFHWANASPRSRPLACSALASAPVPLLRSMQGLHCGRSSVKTGREGVWGTITSRSMLAALSSG